MDVFDEIKITETIKKIENNSYVMALVHDEEMDLYENICDTLSDLWSELKSLLDFESRNNVINYAKDIERVSYECGVAKCAGDEVTLTKKREFLKDLWWELGSILIHLETEQGGDIVNLKYSLSPCEPFVNLILENLINGRCLVVLTTDHKTARCALENANIFLDDIEALADWFPKCKTVESACEHLNYCFGFLFALNLHTQFSFAEKNFVEEYIVYKYNKRIGELKNETCE